MLKRTLVAALALSWLAAAARCAEEAYELSRGGGATLELKRGGELAARAGVLVLWKGGKTLSSEGLEAEAGSEFFRGKAPGPEVRVGLGRRSALAGAGAGPVFVEAEVAGDPTVEGFAVAVELPAAVWRGGTARIGSGESKTLPVEAGGAAGAAVASGEGVRVSFQRAPGAGPGLVVERAQPGRIEVTDARASGGGGFRVLLHLARDERANGAFGCRTMIHMGERPYAGPVTAALGSVPETVEAREAVEISVDLFAPGADVFSKAEVTLYAEVACPSGLVERRQGFFSRPYARSLRTDGGKAREEVRPAGEGSWRLRLLPEDPGEYRVKLVASTPERHEEHEVRFTAVESERAGFVRPSARDARFFERQGRGSYFPVGVNLCWPDETGLADCEKYLDRLQACGINSIRVWSATWWCPLDGDRPGRVNLESAWKLEELLRMAAERDITVRLCIENFWDFTRNRGSNVFFDKARGGMCAEAGDFFSLLSAREAYRRKLDYLVARFGAETNLFAWELWNEMNYCLGEGQGAPPPEAFAEARDKMLIPWTREMAAYIRDIDRGRHMVTTSLGGSEVWPGLWELGEMDYCQIHAYIPPTAKDAGSLSFNAAEFALERLGRIEGFLKPRLIAEFGFAPDAGGGSSKSTLNEKDPTGIHLHNAIWASSLGGAAGCAQMYWWDHYIRPNDLWYHYAALSRFVSGVDFAGGRFARMRGPEESEVAITGLKSRIEGYVWVQNRESTWRRRIVEGKAPRALSGVRLGIPNVERGTYRVEWWDTYAGKVLTGAEQRDEGGILRLVIPDFTTDIALRFRKLER